MTGLRAGHDSYLSIDAGSLFRILEALMAPFRSLTAQVALVVVLLTCSPQTSRCQSTGASSAQTESSFMAAFRTSAHVQRSSPSVFNEDVDEAVEFLRSSDVVLANDPLRAPANQLPRLQEDMSRDDLLASATAAGAAYLLLITVDRPVRQWLKVTVECYDLSGKM